MYTYSLSTTTSVHIHSSYLHMGLPKMKSKDSSCLLLSINRGNWQTIHCKLELEYYQITKNIVVAKHLQHQFWLNSCSRKQNLNKFQHIILFSYNYHGDTRTLVKSALSKPFELLLSVWQLNRKRNGSRGNQYILVERPESKQNSNFSQPQCR